MLRNKKTRLVLLVGSIAVMFGLFQNFSVGVPYREYSDQFQQSIGTTHQVRKNYDGKDEHLLIVTGSFNCGIFKNSSENACIKSARNRVISSMYKACESRQLKPTSSIFGIYSVVAGKAGKSGIAVEAGARIICFK